MKEFLLQLSCIDITTFLILLNFFRSNTLSSRNSSSLEYTTCSRCSMTNLTIQVKVTQLAWRRTVAEHLIPQYRCALQSRSTPLQCFTSSLPAVLMSFFTCWPLYDLSNASMTELKAGPFRSLI